jgi:acetyl esterase/lipase
MKAFLFVFGMLCCSLAVAEEPPVIKLWPQGAPLAKGDKETDQPTITVFLAPSDKATGTAVVICPGGGYSGLATSFEGVEIANFFNKLGVSAFMLRYRHGGNGYRHPAPLIDAQRALRTVRARAAEWHLNPQRIGIIGFSAGGHLASTLGTHFDAGQSDAEDPIDRVSCRPDFLILCYPVVMLDSPYTHPGSQQNLLGEQPDPKMLENLSNEKQVTKDTPPTFMFHTNADIRVPPENSVMFYLALRKHGVPSELHIYQDGKHGVGLAARVPATSSWPERLIDWMRLRGLLNKAS